MNDFAVLFWVINIAVGASMALLTGGNEDNERTAAIGGLIGGIGVLIVLSHLAIFSKIETVASFDMPISLVLY